MERKIKIGYISAFPPEDRFASSGTNFKMVEKLKEIGELKWIPVKTTKLGRIVIRLATYWNRCFNKHILIDGTKIGSFLRYAKIREKEYEDCDVIAAFFCMPIVYRLKTGKPVIYFSDATFPAMLDYYPDFSNLFTFNKINGGGIEKTAMDKTSAIVLSSNWAASSAISDLQQDESKIKVVEFGANIDDQDIMFTERKVKDMVHVLFVGVDWVRKGGEIAVETVKWLNDNGVPSKLHIVGITELPDKFKSLSWIENHGFLNKNVPQQYSKLIKLYNMAHCLLLPTMAECAGIAFAEASAYGLPTFTHDTGGISNYIYNGKNGYMLPLGSTGADFGSKIKEALTSGELEKMSVEAHYFYRTQLNWNTWGEKVKSIIETLI